MDGNQDDFYNDVAVLPVSPVVDTPGNGDQVEGVVNPDVAELEQTLTVSQEVTKARRSIENEGRVSVAMTDALEAYGYTVYNGRYPKASFTRTATPTNLEHVQSVLSAGKVTSSNEEHEDALPWGTKLQKQLADELAFAKQNKVALLAATSEMTSSHRAFMDLYTKAQKLGLDKRANAAEHLDSDVPLGQELTGSFFVSVDDPVNTDFVTLVRSRFVRFVGAELATSPEYLKSLLDDPKRVSHVATFGDVVQDFLIRAERTLSDNSEPVEMRPVFRDTTEAVAEALDPLRAEKGIQVESEYTLCDIVAIATEFATRVGQWPDLDSAVSRVVDQLAKRMDRSRQLDARSVNGSVEHLEEANHLGQDVLDIASLLTTMVGVETSAITWTRHLVDVVTVGLYYARRDLINLLGELPTLAGSIVADSNKEFIQRHRDEIVASYDRVRASQKESL